MSSSSNNFYDMLKARIAQEQPSGAPTALAPVLQDAPMAPPAVQIMPQVEALRGPLTSAGVMPIPQPTPEPMPAPEPLPEQVPELAPRVQQEAMQAAKERADVDQVYANAQSTGNALLDAQIQSAQQQQSLVARGFNNLEQMGVAHAQEIARINAKEEAELQKNQKQVDDLRNQILGTINTETPSMGKNILGRFALALGAAGASLGGGPNMALEIIKNRAMQTSQEMAHKRGALESALGITQDNAKNIRNMFGSRKDMQQQMYSTLLAGAQNKLEYQAKMEPMPAMRARLLASAQAVAAEREREDQMLARKQAHDMALINARGRWDLAKESMAQQSKRAEQDVLQAPPVFKDPKGVFGRLAPAQKTNLQETAGLYAAAIGDLDKLESLYKQMTVQDQVLPTKRSVEVQRLQNNFVLTVKKMKDLGASFTKNEEKLIMPRDLSGLNFANRGINDLRATRAAIKQNMAAHVSGIGNGLALDPNYRVPDVNPETGTSDDIGPLL